MNVSEILVARPIARAPRALHAGGTGRIALISVTLAFVGAVVVLPVVAVLVQAFGGGLVSYLRALSLPDSLSALFLTLKVAAVVVPANVAFGLAAGWAIGKFDFRGKALLTALIEIPFAVSPVVSGLIFVLSLGPRTPVGAWLADHDIRILFSWPAIMLATTFVTFPYVAREVITAMESTGRDQEEAAAILGASGLRTFFQITLPRIRWALFYGVILCNARAMGEFGAVSVVSGHVRGSTNTLPSRWRCSTTTTASPTLSRWPRSSCSSPCSRSSARRWWSG
jgi:sulfate transport system permease protein